MRIILVWEKDRAHVFEEKWRFREEGCALLLPRPNDKHDRTIEAFSPAVENGFSSAKFLVDPQVLYAKRRYNTPEVFDSKNLHNRFSIPGLNAPHATGKIQFPACRTCTQGLNFCLADCAGLSPNTVSYRSAK